jgi:hypothetical protein
LVPDEKRPAENLHRLVPFPMNWRTWISTTPGPFTFVTAGLLCLAAQCNSAPAVEKKEAIAYAETVRAEVLKVDLSRESLVYRRVEIRFSNPGTRGLRIRKYVLAWPGGRKETAPLKIELAPGGETVTHVKVTARDGNLGSLTRGSARVEVFLVEPTR